MELYFGKTIKTLGPSLLKGIGVVLEVTIIGFLGALVIGLFIAIARMSKKRVVRGIIGAFVELIRGTPLLVQFFYIYYVIPLLFSSVLKTMGIDYNVQISSIVAGIIGFSINYGCYMSEVIRSSILSIDPGQREAGLALGFSEVEVLFKIIIPPALRNSVPVFGNYLVMMIKDTSLLACITVNELLLRTQAYASQTYNTIESYTLLAAVYLLLSIPLSQFVKYVEKRMNKFNRNS